LVTKEDITPTVLEAALPYLAYDVVHRFWSSKRQDGYFRSVMAYMALSPAMQGSLRHPERKTRIVELLGPAIGGICLWQNLTHKTNVQNKGGLCAEARKQLRTLYISTATFWLDFFDQFEELRHIVYECSDFHALCMSLWTDVHPDTGRLFEGINNAEAPCQILRLMALVYDNDIARANFITYLDAGPPQCLRTFAKSLLKRADEVLQPPLVEMALASYIPTLFNIIGESMRDPTLYRALKRLRPVRHLTSLISNITTYTARTAGSSGHPHLICIMFTLRVLINEITDKRHRRVLADWVEMTRGGMMQTLIILAQAITAFMDDECHGKGKVVEEAEYHCAHILSLLGMFTMSPSILKGVMVFELPPGFEDSLRRSPKILKNWKAFYAAIDDRSRSLYSGGGDSITLCDNIGVSLTIITLSTASLRLSSVPIYLVSVRGNPEGARGALWRSTVGRSVSAKTGSDFTDMSAP